MPLTLPRTEFVSAEQALEVYYQTGLRPILIHAPKHAGNGDKRCTCGKDHEACGKHPIASAWQKPASLDDLKQHRARLTFEPNVGIVLGEQQNQEYLIAIDVDDEARLHALEGELGALPETVRGESGRGYRLLFEYPRGLLTTNLKNITGLTPHSADDPARAKISGVDVKVKGGQVVVAPSQHVNGKRYTWTRVGVIETLPMSWALEIAPQPDEIPKWVAEFTPQSMRDDAKAKRRAEAYLERAVMRDAGSIAACGKGMRNSLLHKRAIALFALCGGLYLGWRWGYVTEQLRRAGIASGLPSREVERTLTSAEKHVREKGLLRVPVALADPVTSTSSATLPPSAESSASIPSQTQPPVSRPIQFVGDDPLSKIVLTEDKGSPAKTASNVALLLQQHPVWGGGPAFDRYSRVEIWPEKIPAPITAVHRTEREIVDADYAVIQGWLMDLPSTFRVRASKDAIVDGVHLACSKKTIDLLQEWMLGLPPWDTKSRMDRWTHRYLGCEDTLYHRGTARAWLLAVVQRALQPGKIVDVIPVLEGAQRSGKNRFLEAMFDGGPSWAPWYTKIGGHNLDKPDSKRLACTRWVLHDDELRSSESKRVEDLKSWASEERETYRVPYAKEITVALRRALLIGSIDRKGYLHDEAGNRRWWPWRTHRVDYEAIARDREQLFAEALVMLRAGAKWRDAITDEVYEAAAAQAEERRIRDPLVEQVAKALMAWNSKGSDGQPTSGGDITTTAIGLCLGYSVERIDKSFETKLGMAMHELGYETRRQASGIRVYVKKEDK